MHLRTCEQHVFVRNVSWHPMTPLTRKQLADVIVSRHNTKACDVMKHVMLRLWCHIFIPNAFIINLAYGYFLHHSVRHTLLSRTVRYALKGTLLPTGKHCMQGAKEIKCLRGSELCNIALLHKKCISYNHRQFAYVLLDYRLHIPLAYWSQFPRFLSLWHSKHMTR